MSKWIGVMATLLVATSFTSCTSVQNQSVGPLGENDGKPFVEAYFEYPGPNRIWAGPQTVIFHVSAKEGEQPHLAVTPASLEGTSEKTHEPSQIKERTLASAKSENVGDASVALAPKSEFTGEMKMPKEAVREEFAHIVASFSDKDPSAPGCLSPVKLKLVRENGVTVEHQGCRGQGGWTKAVSESASRFLASALTVPTAGYTAPKKLEKEIPSAK